MVYVWELYVDTLLEMDLIYIYILYETWNLKMYERYVWVFCRECVWEIYGNVR